MNKYDHPDPLRRAAHERKDADKEARPDPGVEDRLEEFVRVVVGRKRDPVTRKDAGSESERNPTPSSPTTSGEPESGRRSKARISSDLLESRSGPAASAAQPEAQPLPRRVADTLVQDKASREPASPLPDEDAGSPMPLAETPSPSAKRSYDLGWEEEFLTLLSGAPSGSDAGDAHPEPPEQARAGRDNGSEERVPPEAAQQATTATRTPRLTVAPSTVAAVNRPTVISEAQRTRQNPTGSSHAVEAAIDGISFRERLDRAAWAAEQATEETQPKELPGDPSADHESPKPAEINADGADAPASPEPEPELEAGPASQDLSPKKKPERSGKGSPAGPRSADAINEASLVAVPPPRLGEKDARSSRWEPQAPPPGGLAGLLSSHKRIVLAASVIAAGIVVGAGLIVLRSSHNAGGNAPAVVATVITPGAIVSGAGQPDGARVVDDVDLPSVPDLHSPKDESRIQGATSVSKAPPGLIGPKDIRAVMIRPDGSVVSSEAHNAFEMRPAPERIAPPSDAPSPTGDRAPEEMGSEASPAASGTASNSTETKAAERLPPSQSATVAGAEILTRSTEDVVLDAGRESVQTPESSAPPPAESNAATSLVTEVAPRASKDMTSAAAPGAARDAAATAKRVPQPAAPVSVEAAAVHKTSGIFAPSETLVARPKNDWTLVFTAPEVTTVSLPVKAVRQEPIPIPRLRPSSHPGIASADEGLADLTGAIARSGANVSDSGAAQQDGSEAQVAKPLNLVPGSGVQFRSPQERQAVLANISEYFNSFDTMEGEFVQVGPRGEQSEGVFYISKPGKIRFRYKPPHRLDVISDGKSVAIHDIDARTQDLYPLSKTPLRFLLAKDIDLTSEALVSDIRPEADLVSVVIEEKSSILTGKLTLIFDRNSHQLRQWIVTDAQGLQTSVAVFNTKTGARPDPQNFKIYFSRTARRG